MDFTKLIREELDRKKMSQHALAVRAGLSDASICLFLQGVRSPRFDTADKICKALGMEILIVDNSVKKCCLSCWQYDRDFSLCGRKENRYAFILDGENHCCDLYEGEGVDP